MPVIVRPFAALALALVGATIAGAGCVGTKDLMLDAVVLRAQQDLQCDEASTKIRQVGVISQYKGGRQGTIQRATFSAEGCGDSEVYNVECVRGICVANKDVAPKDKDKKVPSYYDDSNNGGAEQQ